MTDKNTPEDKDFEYTTGMDIADSIGLILLCLAVVMAVFFLK
jgi:hypothetical protein